MKNAKIAIRPADVARINYMNQFKAKPGEPIKLSIKNNYAVKLNTAAPTNAVVIFKFEAKSEDGTITFEVETLTAVSASTYIDDLEEVIKNQYIAFIMAGVNEKIKTIATTVGLNINFPAITVPYGEQDDNADSLDNILNYNGKS